MAGKFKVGDRVAAYGENSNSGYRHVGEVLQFHTDGRLLLQLKGGSFWYVHPKQCRRLVKRKRRRVWIREQDIPKALNSGHAVISAAELVGEKYVQFIEVRKKRRG